MNIDVYITDYLFDKKIEEVGKLHIKINKMHARKQLKEKVK